MTRLAKLFSPEVLRWVVVGVVFSALSVGFLKVFAGILGWPYALATIGSGELTTLLRFVAVDRWVFGHRKPTFTRLWQYHVANAVGFGVWWGAANLLKAAGIEYLLASVLASFFSVGVNLVSNFVWVWRKPKPPVVPLVAPAPEASVPAE